MLSRSFSKILATLGVFLSLLSLACTPTKRGSHVPGDPVTAIIDLRFPSSQFRDDPNLVYEMSSCTADVQGVKLENNRASFKAAGLKAGQTCDIKVKTLVTSIPNVQFVVEDSLLFLGSPVVLRDDVDGQLTGVALLEIQYKISPPDGAKSATINVAVKFPEAKSPAKVVTAALDCAPTIVVPGTFKAGVAPGDGTISFVVPSDKEVSYKCNYINVGQSGNGFAFRGTWNPGTEFTLAPDKNVDISVVALAVFTPPGPGEITVNVQAGECAAGKVFNSATSQCE